MWGWAFPSHFSVCLRKIFHYMSVKFSAALRFLANLADSTGYMFIVIYSIDCLLWVIRNYPELRIKKFVWKWLSAKIYERCLPKNISLSHSQKQSRALPVDQSWANQSFSSHKSSQVKSYPNFFSTKSSQVKSYPKLFSTKSSQVKSNQVNSNQVKSSQVKSNQVKSNQVKSTHPANFFSFNLTQVRLKLR